MHLRAGALLLQRRHAQLGLLDDPGVDAAAEAFIRRNREGKDVLRFVVPLHSNMGKHKVLNRQCKGARCVHGRFSLAELRRGDHLHRLGDL
eukprot:scaffold343_cov120-Isochrysis_galbana.AAC.13